MFKKYLKVINFIVYLKDICESIFILHLIAYLWDFLRICSRYFNKVSYMLLNAHTVLV